VARGPGPLRPVRRADTGGRGLAEASMKDLVFLLLTALLFAASIWYTRRCDRI
jgi:hypothetical protein